MKNSKLTNKSEINRGTQITLVDKKNQMNNKQQQNLNSIEIKILHKTIN